MQAGKMYFSTLILVCVTINSLVNANAVINTIPQGQSNFDINRFQGIWYTQGTIAPSSWSGSVVFTDWEINYVVGDQMEYVLNWRSRGQCVEVRSDMTTSTPDSPATYNIIDPIGDLFTGTLTVVATDYTNYGIVYGCVRKSVVDPSQCAIPWLTVDTRDPSPGLFVRTAFNLALNRIFGFTLPSTQLVPQTEEGYCPGIVVY